MSPTASGSLLVLISSPSGGGKTTICERVLSENPNTTRVITCTTREPRTGERHGVDYYFLDSQTFSRRVQAGEFLEHAVVHSNHYGILKSEVYGKLSDGRDVLLNLDVQGAATVRRAAGEDARLRNALVSVFIAPPSLGALAERLNKRATDSSDVIQKRLAAAKEEVAHWAHYDYLILSGTISEDVRRLQAIIAAEKLRTSRAQPPAL